MFNPNPKGRSRRSSNLKVVSSRDEPLENNGNSVRSFLFLLIFGAVLAFAYHIVAEDKGSPTVVNEDGETILHPDRQAKLDKELEEFDEAVQYALFVTVDGYYPCYSCPDVLPTIYLYEGEIWRYGSTRKGEKGRYPDGNYGTENLLYVEQFWGTELECRKREKIMIYSYPLLPEALKRKIKLFRPPGNKNDN